MTILENQALISDCRDSSREVLISSLRRCCPLRSERGAGDGPNILIPGPDGAVRPISFAVLSAAKLFLLETIMAARRP